MTPAALQTRLRDRPLLTDGAMGTMLIRLGLPIGVAPETWIADHPERILEVHCRYVEAGSDMIHTATFGANPSRLRLCGLEAHCAETNAAAVKLARRASDGRALVAGNLGPSGRFLAPRGEANEQALEQEFLIQCEALAEAGCDLLSIETMYDVREALAAVRAACSTGLAVMCSMTFTAEPNGAATFLGDALIPSLQALALEGATVVGCNCSVASQSMGAMMEHAVRDVSSAWLIAQPNAGQPIATTSGYEYDAHPEAFAKDMMAMVDRGVRVVGGCCGTDDRFISALRRAVDTMARR